MDFIVAASNLRAANYSIPPADRHKVWVARVCNVHTIYLEKLAVIFVHKVHFKFGVETYV